MVSLIPSRDASSDTQRPGPGSTNHQPSSLLGASDNDTYCPEKRAAGPDIHCTTATTTLCHFKCVTELTYIAHCLGIDGSTGAVVFSDDPQTLGSWDWTIPSP